MRKWLITGPGRIDHPVTSEESIQFLSRVSAESVRVGVTVLLSEHEGERFLTVGIGQVYCFVNFHRCSDPPYYSSVDTRDFAEEGFAVFDCDGTPTEIPIRNCVSREVMLEAVRSLLVSDDLPSVCGWEMD